MITCFAKTSIGYSHIRDKKPCQDFSACYNDLERTIITACDGHGGDLYVRSNLGSKFASDAAINILRSVDRLDFYKYSRREICDKIRLNILCEWNSAVSDSLNKKRLGKCEVSQLPEEKILKLIKAPEKAYGTTLNAAMIYANKLFCVSIGDGGIFAIKKGLIAPLFMEDEESVANLTCSMSQEDAYKHLNVEIYDFSRLDGVMVCTDGLINPYQNLNNFRNGLVIPISAKLIEGKSSEIGEFIQELGERIGNGDDVSLGIAMRSDVSLRRYKV